MFSASSVTVILVVACVRVRWFARAGTPSFHDRTTKSFAFLPRTLGLLVI